MLDLRRYAAEFFGTFVLVFGGTTAIISALVGGNTPPVPVLLIVPFAFAFALLAGLYAFGEVSGGHFNPAVSLAMFLGKRLGARDFASYCVAQILGGIAASLVLLVITNQKSVAETATTPHTNGSAFAIELVCTAIFVCVILQASQSERFGTSALIAIPLTLLLLHIVAIPFSGCSVNPARTIGPDLVGNVWTGIWIYLIATPLGAALGWAVHRYVTSKDDTAESGVAEVLREPAS